jgi:hypothetical protein
MTRRRRPAREPDLIDRLGRAGDRPHDQLLRGGQGEMWRAAAAHTAAGCVRPAVGTQCPQVTFPVLR